ncbi:MAG: subclass B3 metallo-beta-lactamase [Gemmataceae bacterium]|nr:subclass B3 metallo-beta-lactamase [Gemmataceae bacterium]
MDRRVRIRLTPVAVVAALGLAASAAGQPPANEPTPPVFLKAARTLLKWDEPAEPAHVLGPIYFAGTKGLGSYLITGSDGHVLLNSGMPGSGPLIEASVKKLGFEPSDVKLLLCGHAHVDHVGGHAHLKKATGAKVAAMREEKELLESGGKLDFQYAGVKEFEFDPVKVDVVFRDEDEVKRGDIALTARLTPGHTRGSTSYVLRVNDGGKTYTVVFPDGTGVNPGYRVAGNPSYPGIGDDFRRTFRVLESLRPDVWLPAHNEVHGLDAKLARAKKDGAKAWADPDGYRKWVALQKGRFEAAAGKE